MVGFSSSLFTQLSIAVIQVLCSAVSPINQTLYFS